MADKLPKAPQRLDDNIAVWAEFEETTKKYAGQSLGQGAPSYSPPKFLRDFMVQAIDEGNNQYTRTFGHPSLVHAIADIYGPKLGRTINPMTEVLVGNGANAINGAFLQAFVHPGDEVVIFEPCFPMYFDHLQFCGGKLRGVPLDLDEATGEWSFNPEKFRAALSSKTKLVILNTPHNPTGKCFTRAELEQISQILDEFPNVFVLSDEVYDFLTFDGMEHVRFASIGNNWNRTISVYSGGKLFNATGWKVGWAIAHPKILRLGGIIANTQSYCVNHPAQVAISRALPLIDQPGVLGPNSPSYVENMRSNFTEVRNYLSHEINSQDMPWKALPCHSGYFMIVDVSKCRDLVPAKYFETHHYDQGEPNPPQKYELYLPGTK